VAIARYVRTLSQPARTRITYVGRCPGAIDDSIDIRMTPDALLGMLAERQIALDEQPRVFESVIPPDRRRFRSQPGGLPSADALWNDAGARTLVEIDGDDLVAELAQQLLSGKNVLIDVSARLGCACSGALGGMSAKDARAGVVALEPPRATTAVVEESAPIDLDLAVPAAPRTPTDVLAISPFDTPPKPFLTPPAAGTMPLGHRISPVRGLSTVVDVRQSRTSSPVNPRAVLGAVPVSRDVEGKSLPRAYVARRRSSPKGIPVMSLPPDDIADPPPLPRRRRASTETTAATDVPSVAEASTRRAGSEIRLALPASLTARHLLYVAGAILLLTLSVSTMVAVIVGRFLR